jgi:hypothetical protein
MTDEELVKYFRQTIVACNSRQLLPHEHQRMSELMSLGLPRKPPEGKPVETAKRGCETCRHDGTDFIECEPCKSCLKDTGTLLGWQSALAQPAGSKGGE